MTSDRKVDLLYVEDDAADVDFAQTAFREIGCGLRMDVVEDGDAAIRYLGLGHEGAQARRTPNVVLLDLNIPKIHGRELLRRIKSSPHLGKLPVIILSTSTFQKDVDDAYALGAAGYFAKPANYDSYKAIFQAICDYWVRRAALPSRDSN
jgi:CheY-like chemotaxis protein